MMQSEDYIGQPLSDCPDETVAVVIPQGADSACVRMLNSGEPWWVDVDFAGLGDDGGDPSSYTVLHIIKLGKPRPRYIADAEHAEVWKSSVDGRLRWRDSDSEYAMELGTDGSPFESSDFTIDIEISDDCVCLGFIEGIVIGGKVYGKEASDG